MKGLLDDGDSVNGTVAVTPQSIYITPANPIVTNGDTVQLNAYLVHSDATETVCTNDVTWTSLNSEVATVNSSGLVSSVSVGTLNIKAVHISHGFQHQEQIVITSARLQSIHVTPKNSTIYYDHPTNNNTLQYTATGNYSDMSTADITALVTWSSSNTSAATINSNGLATAQSTGGATVIGVQLSTVTAMVNLTVKTKIYRISEDFEGAFPPAGWTGDFGPVDWNTDGSYSHGGSKSANFSSNEVTGYEGSLKTPSFNLSGLEDPKISFWYMSKTKTGVMIDYWNVMIIYRSNDGISLTKLHEYNSAWGFEDWSFHTYDLTASTQYFSFLGKSGWALGRNYDTHVDEVKIYGWGTP